MPICGFLRVPAVFRGFLEGREVQNCELKKFSVFQAKFCFSNGHVLGVFRMGAPESAQNNRCVPIQTQHDFPHLLL